MDSTPRKQSPNAAGSRAKVSLKDLKPKKKPKDGPRSNEDRNANHPSAWKSGKTWLARHGGFARGGLRLIDISS
jgi:hypothetical protein